MIDEHGAALGAAGLDAGRTQQIDGTRDGRADDEDRLALRDPFPQSLREERDLPVEMFHRQAFEDERIEHGRYPLVRIAGELDRARQHERGVSPDRRADVVQRRGWRGRLREQRLGGLFVRQ